MTTSTIKTPAIFAVTSASVEVIAFTMTQDSLSFDQLPGAVMSLTALVKELSREVCELRGQLAALSENSKQSVNFIGIDRACSILGKAKSTIYALAREGKLPAYKDPGDKEWKFIEDELINVVKGNKSVSKIQSFEDMEANLRKGTRPRNGAK